MTKKELLAAGLTEEQVAEVFRLHGLVVTATKGDLTAVEKDLEDTKTLLGEANTKIEDLSKLDYEEIAKEAADYKDAFEKAEIKREKEIATLKFDHQLDQMITSPDFKGKSPKAIKALLDLEEIKESKDIAATMKEKLTELRTAQDYLFDEVDPEGTGGSKGNQGKDKKVPKPNFGKTLAASNKEDQTTDTSAYEL